MPSIRGSRFIFLVLMFLSVAPSQAQEVLPEFKVVKRNGWAIISWNNNNRELTQLIIQRSADSAKGFRSITSMPDPTSTTNGYVDKKPGSENAYYRIFYVMPGSRYMFTVSKKPVTEELPLILPPQLIPILPNGGIKPEINGNIGKLSPKDSVTSWKKQTDTSFNLLMNAYQNIMLSRSSWKPEQEIPRPDSSQHVEIKNPSILVFTNAEGNLIVAQPVENKTKYTLRVFQDENNILFEMKNIKEKELLIDRSNFHRSGWFGYELLQGGIVKEKSKFYIKPDVK